MFAHNYIIFVKNMSIDAIHQRDLHTAATQLLSTTPNPRTPTYIHAHVFQYYIHFVTHFIKFVFYLFVYRSYKIEFVSFAISMRIEKRLLINFS